MKKVILLKNKPEEMTSEEFRKDKYCGYGLTHFRVNELFLDNLNKSIVIATLSALISIVAFQMGYTHTAFMLLGFYAGMGSICMLILKKYQDMEFTMFRKVEVIDE